MKLNSVLIYSLLIVGEYAQRKEGSSKSPGRRATPKKKKIPESYHHAENIALRYLGKGLNYVLSNVQGFINNVDDQPEGPFKDMLSKLTNTLDSDDIPEAISPVLNFVKDIKPSTLDPDSEDFNPMLRAQMKLLIRVVKGKLGDETVDGLFKEIDKYPDMVKLMKKHVNNEKDEL
ncbi:hypothetical protein CONCODRAFT_9362 [Conidiobolus coronatus NRRL 28638]|uniref:Uncharacterized protein n=1 Tax=Conidiobolus coronatus (strain ATCC 28846 / CBS 209.66 / NRRL 28638) TaxID=796925 RepID=A0A137P001_CONC2|nr:hypothetical protein CONCODRAFT_9362 [Conidiobolus coronatus NRRL 28638]|eukprot:KXN68396.1 hypothetical protein CONCODRAFT_9362 [Conidiobolus coronatus NRRL 28638]